MNAGVAYTIGAAPKGYLGVSGSIFLAGSTGDASSRVPAMSWRMCFTTNTSNMVNQSWSHARDIGAGNALDRAAEMPVPIPPPQYNRSVYTGYLADVNAGRIGSVFEVGLVVGFRVCVWSSKIVSNHVVSGHL